MNPKDILWRIAKGEEVAGLDGKSLPPLVRSACIEGAKALGIVAGIAALVDGVDKQGSGSAQHKDQAPRGPKPQPVSGGFEAGKRWSAEEDEALRAEHTEGLSVEAMAEKHRRTVAAIAMRLVKPLGVWTEDEARKVIDAWRATLPPRTSAEAAEAASPHPTQAPAVPAPAAEGPVAEFSKEDEAYIAAVLAKKGKAPVELLANHVRTAGKCSPQARDHLLRELGVSSEPMKSAA